MSPISRTDYLGLNLLNSSLNFSNSISFESIFNARTGCTLGCNRFLVAVIAL